MLIQEPVIIRLPDTFKSHAPNSPPDILIKFVKTTKTGGEWCREVSYATSNNTIKGHDHIGIQMVTPTGNILDLILKAFFRFFTHANGED